MLFQDDCGGLQVEDPNAPGQFVNADPVEGALVMNVGDVLMRWSNGAYFCLTEKRNPSRQRRRIPLFPQEMLMSCLFFAETKVSFQKIT